MAPIRLQVLGSVELRDDQLEPVTAVLNQPRRVALLTYLAIEANSGGISRDRITGVFWPDESESQARAALRQGLYFLRQSFGCDPVLRSGQLLVLNQSVLSCDAVEFLEFLDRRDYAAALRAYSGDFLTGFFLDRAPVEFERWLEDKRLELRRLAAESAWKAADIEEKAGNQAGAGAFGRRAASLTQGDEAALRRLLELLARIGDKAGALAEYRVFSSRLETEYSAVPATETLELVESLRGPCPPAFSPTDALPQNSSEEEGEAISASPSTPAQGYQIRRVGSVVASLVVIVAFASLWGHFLTGEDRQEVSGSLPPLIVVEEVGDFGSEDGRPFARALTSEILGQLGGLPLMQAAPASLVRGEATRAEPFFLLRASVTIDQNSLSASATLMEGHSGVVLDHFSSSHSYADPVQGMVLKEVAREIVAFVRTESGEAARVSRWPSRRAAVVTAMRDALRDKARGDSLRLVGSVTAATGYLTQADSQLATLELREPEWGEISVLRAQTSLSLMWLSLLPPQHSLEEARSEMLRGVEHAERALRLNPADPGALESRGLLQKWLWLTSPTDSADAAARFSLAAERDLLAAVEVSPTRPRAWNGLSTLQFARGDFGLAHWAAERARRADIYMEDSRNLLIKLFDASFELGDMTAAARTCGEITEQFASLWLSGYCELALLAADSATGRDDVKMVWTILERSLQSPQNHASMRPRLQMLASASLARAGLQDSATAVLSRAKAEAGGDPEVLLLEAWTLRLLNQDHAARLALATYIARNPITGTGVSSSWRFRGLMEATPSPKPGGISGAPASAKGPRRGHRGPA